MRVLLQLSTLSWGGFPAFVIVFVHVKANKRCV